MSATPRKPAAKTSRASASTGRSSTARRSTSTRRSASSRAPRGYSTRRRRQPGLPSTIGAALGTVIVASLLNMSWPVRIGLLATVIVVGIVYILWKNRAEIAAAAVDDPPTAPTDQPGADGIPADATGDDPNPTDGATP